MNIARHASPYLLFAAAACLGAPLQAQIDAQTADAIKREGIENSHVMDILDRLTNGIGSRLTGSDSFTRACEWARDEFRSFGMTQVELEKWDTWPITWNREQWMGRIVEPEAMELQVATEAWTNGTKGRVSGELIAMPEKVEDLRSGAETYRGKWLFGRLPSSRSPEYRPFVAAGTEAGIAGFLVSSSGDSANPNRIRVFGDRPHSAEIPDSPPQIVIRRDQAQHIRELLDAGKTVVGEFEIRNRWRKQPIDLNNVIAEIPGTEKPEEVVIVSAHLDSWHQATGTTDNGTGACSTLEAARILMAIGAKPKRTIRFCLWGGEEQGLLGSLAYTTRHRTEMEKVSAVFNHDTGTNWAHGLTVTTAMEPMMRKVLEPVMTLKAPDDIGDDPVFDLRAAPRIGGGMGGSDHASFLRTGVPAFDWSLTGRSDYFSHTWHSQWDTYDEAIPEYMRHTSTVVALTVLGVANLPEMLPREGVGGSGGEGQQRPRGSFIGRGLGIEFDEADGLKVARVVEGGAAATAGIKAGDRIQSFNGKAVASADELGTAARAVFGDENAGKVDIVFARGDSTVKMTVEASSLMRGPRRNGNGRAPGSGSGGGTAPGTSSGSGSTGGQGSRRGNADS
ncbi:MAG: M20/M25/M40 family metallo-hydrolase [Planctomycetota bacterium]